MDSLEDLCLDLICEKFERFNFAFTVSKEKVLKKNFEFLQRKYSYQLISGLEVKDEYIEFLINEHLTELNSFWFDESHYCNSMEDILCRLPNLKKFCFRAVCSDGHLESMAKFCPKVVEINICLSPVTDNGIKFLCKDQNGIVPCPELKKLLTDRCCCITDESVKCLIRDLPSLEIIDYPNAPKLLYDLHEGDLPELENIRTYELIELDLLRFHSLPYYADLLKVCLSVCPKLKSMKCCITDKGQLNFFNNTSLVELHLQFTIFPKINIDNFLKINGNNLLSLKLYNCLLSISDLVVSCPKLKHLYISDDKYPDDDSQLFWQSMACCKSDREKLNFFSNTSLVELHLQFADKIPEINIENFLNILGNNLVSLKLYNCLLSIADLIVSCPKLKQLYVNHVKILDDESQPVSTSLVECTFQDTSIKEVFFLLLSSPELKSISFNSCILYSEVETNILRLVEGRSLTNLSFERCSVNWRFARNILLKCSSSFILYLSDCGFRSREKSELCDLAAALGHWPTVEFGIDEENSEYDSEEEMGSFWGFDPHDLYSYPNNFSDDMGSPSD